MLNARITMSASRALAGVILPIYLADEGFSAVKLGLLLSVVAVTSAIMSSSIGLLSDRLGRKPFIVFVPLLSAGAAAVFASTTVVPILFVAAAIGAFGRGSGAGGGGVGPYMPAEQALLSDKVDAKRRNSLFGRLAFSSAVGALIGSQLAVTPDIARHFGVANHTAFSITFVVIAVLAAAAGLIAIPVRETQTTRTVSRSPFALPRRSMRFLVKLWITNSMNGFAIGMLGPFLTYWFHVRYGAGAGEIGILYAIINIASMVSVLSASSVAGRFGLVRSVVIARTLQAALLAAMVLAPSFWLAGFIYLLRMLAARVGMPLRQSYVMAMTPQEERAAVAGLANLPAQAASAGSPSIGGYLLDHVALAVPFEIAALFQLLNTGFFFLFFRKMPPPEELARGRGEREAASSESSERAQCGHTVHGT